MTEHQIRLLIVIDRFLVGGTETNILTTIPTLIQNNVHVVVVGSDGPLTQSFREVGCKIYDVEFPINDTVPAFMWRDIEAQLSEIIEEEKINIIHGHQIPSARFAARIAQRRNIPVFFTAHGTYYETPSLQSVLGSHVRIISVSPPVRDWLMDSGINSTVIPNGIPTEQYTPLDTTAVRSDYHVSNEVPVVVYAGRLAWEKADICISTLNACHRIRQEFLPDLQVFVAGDGNGYDAVSNHANFLNASNGAPYISCLGQQLNMNPVYALGNCVVGTGRVALEAMACERAVIGVGCKGMVGIVKPEHYDKILDYHFGDHKADRPVTEAGLASAITGLLSSAETCVTLGKNGRQLVDAKFNIRDIATKLLNMYRDTFDNNYTSRTHKQN